MGLIIDRDLQEIFAANLNRIAAEQGISRSLRSKESVFTGSFLFRVNTCVNTIKKEGHGWRRVPSPRKKCVWQRTGG